MRVLREQVLALGTFVCLDHFDGRTVADYVLRGEAAVLGGFGAPLQMVQVGVSCAAAFDYGSESSIHCPAGERTAGKPSSGPTGDVGLAELR